MRALTSKNICVSVRWVILWVRPPPLCENMCVRSLGYIVGASPPLCVRSIANTCMLPTPLCGIFEKRPLICLSGATSTNI